MKLTKLQKLGIACGSSVLITILYATTIFPSILKMQVRQKVALKPGWFLRNLWSKFPFCMDFSFYIFNVTNAEGIKNGEKPKLQQVGPFVYEEWHEKTNQVDNDSDDTILYNAKYTYIFSPEKSNGLTGDEEVIFPNLMILGIINTLLRDKPSSLPIAGKAIDSVFKKPDSIFFKAKVKDLLFDGILIDCVGITDFAGTAICGELKSKYLEFGLKTPGPDQYFMSFFGSRNATESSAKTRVYRGFKNIMDVGKVIEHNNKPNISVWKDDQCDEFTGTDGTVFHPYFDKSGKDPLIAFNPSLCRNVVCEFHTKSKFAGMKTLRYTTDLGVDPENNSNHTCFCKTPVCMKKGVFDLYPCVSAPFVLSNPHFYLADPWYLDSVVGLSPIQEEHMIIIDIDAFTGAPVHARIRAQMNMFITSVEKFKLMKTFPDALLPLMWFEEKLIMPDVLLNELKFGHKLLNIGITVKYIFILVTLGIGGYAGYTMYKSNNEKKVHSTKQNISLQNPSNNADKKFPINTLQAATVPPNIE